MSTGELCMRTVTRLYCYIDRRNLPERDSSAVYLREWASRYPEDVLVARNLFFPSLTPVSDIFQFQNQ